MYSYIQLSVYAVLITAVVLILKWVFKPYFIKKHYMKYPNVEVNPDAGLFLGDFYDDSSDEETETETHINLILNKPDVDLMVEFIGREPFLYFCSHDAIREFKKLCPTKIDRDDSEKYMFGKMYARANDKQPTDEAWKKRQQIFFKRGTLKRPQPLIPEMVDALDERIEEWKKGKTIDFLEEFSDIANDVVCYALFGDNFWDEIEDIQYRGHDGKTEMMEFTDAVQYIPDDCDESYNNSKLGIVFPILNDKNLIEPFKTDEHNISEVYRSLRKYLLNPKRKGFTDIEYLKGMDKSQIDVDIDGFMNDIFNLIDAGAGTIILTLCSCMYRLKQNPKVMKKLLAELKSSGIRKECLSENGFSTEASLELIQKCDYLNYVVKESMRIDPPTFATTSYKTLENLTICGVPVAKGTKLSVNIATSHFNPKQWRDPLKFIPERFDPTSEYFCKPNSTEARDSTAYIPFSVGPRACPGLSYAMTSTKTYLAHLLCRIEYEVDSKLLENKHVYFGLEAYTSFKAKLTRKIHY